VPDFRQYQDPGIYIERQTAPSVISPVVSPTVVALIGDTQRFRTFSETVRLSSSAASSLSNYGIDVTTIVVKNRLTGVTYQSARIGYLNADITSGATSIQVVETATVPTVPFDIYIDAERMTVSSRSAGPGYYTYTVSRGVGGTTAAAHLASAVVNKATGADYTINVQGGEDGLIGGPDDTTTIGLLSGSSMHTAIRSRAMER
jgi:hypothetical protein